MWRCHGYPRPRVFDGQHMVKWWVVVGGLKMWEAAESRLPASLMLANWGPLVLDKGGRMA